MVSDVHTGVGAVGGVDTGGDAPGELGAVVGDEPLGGVEAQDVTDAVLLDAETDHALGEALAVLPVPIDRV